MSGLAPWVWWILAGLVLLGIEMLAGTMFLLWIACAAFVAGLVAIFVPVWYVPWLVFAVAAIVLVLLTRPLARSIHGRVTRASNVDAMIGRQAIVIETIDPLQDVGRVRVGSEEWRARSNGVVLQGAAVKVTKVEGTMLMVQPVETDSTASQS